MKAITVDNLRDWQTEGKVFQLIDVREADEYAQSNLGGLLIPLSQVLDEADQIKQDIPVVIHCRSGKRSEMAIRLLERDLGYTNLHNLTGGILAWQELEHQHSH
jgi:rhodanese-related sulfurtransferase